MNEVEIRLRALLIRGLDGDELAYRTFLHELSARLRAFFRKRLGGLPDEVEDLVQETLLAIHQKRHTYDPGQPVTGWVHAIAGYKLVDMYRGRAHREALTDPIEDEEALSDIDRDTGDARRDLQTLLERLPERQRLPILYVKLEGLSVAETAQRTGMSISAVKVGVHRGLKALAAIVQKRR